MEVICLAVLLVTLFPVREGREKVLPNISEILNRANPDASRNVSELIASKGYPVEDYDVQTSDGYILTIQHIPCGQKKCNSNSTRKEIVLLQHGLLASSADWVMNLENQSLGFILADLGYDVWLGNVRGNTYARRHVKYSLKQKEFWQFSFDEMATYDLPAMIDFILMKTNEKQLYYIGHSQGTTMAFALLSEKPEYNEKIKLLLAFAPVATIGYMTSAIRYFAPFTNDLMFLFKLLGFQEFLPSNIVMKFLSEVVCNTEMKVLCKNIIFLLCGTDSSQLNETRLDVYTSHSPAGTSTQNVIHWVQMLNSKKFQKYDFGPEKNLRIYNQSSPPEYKIEQIKASVSLFWSLNDLLADPTDVGLLHQRLKNVIGSYCVKFPMFNHLDFVYGIDAVDMVYKGAISLLKNS